MSLIPDSELDLSEEYFTLKTPSGRERRFETLDEALTAAKRYFLVEKQKNFGAAIATIRRYAITN